MRFEKVALLVLLALCALAARFLLTPTTNHLPACTLEIHLRPWGGPLPKNLSANVQTFIGKPIIVDATEAMPRAAFEEKRRQYDTDKLGFPVDRTQFVLVITPEDLFTSQISEWRYCFGARFDQGGIVSSAHMGPFPGEAPGLAGQRLEKMTLRYILEGAYGMKRVDDPKSLLFSRVLGPDDLDRMELRY